MGTQRNVSKLVKYKNIPQNLLKFMSERKMSKMMVPALIPRQYYHCRSCFPQVTSVVRITIHNHINNYMFGWVPYISPSSHYMCKTLITLSLAWGDYIKHFKLWNWKVLDQQDPLTKACPETKEWQADVKQWYTRLINQAISNIFISINVQFNLYWNKWALILI